MAQAVKNSPAVQETGSIPVSVRAPAEGNGNPLQYPCLENPIYRGVRCATVHRVAKSQTQLSTCALYCHKEMLLKEITLLNIKLKF